MTVAAGGKSGCGVLLSLLLVVGVGVNGVQWWVAGYFIRVSHGPHMRVCL